MRRSTAWPLAAAAVMLLGCIGPFADTFDEAVQDTPANYDECCVDADRALLERLAGGPVTVATGGDLDTVRIDAVVTTRQLDAATERDVSWGKDGDGLIANDDATEYVLALVRRPAGGDQKARILTTVTVFARPADAWRTSCPSATACTLPAVYESAPLVDPSDGSPVASMIIAVRVPVGHTALLTTDPPKSAGPAVDLRTGRAAKFPGRA
ncbi:hypothetical protein Daura_13535 [Dactylosporangium aurantiacum]|uniref:Lipoprotein n=1 Tax=Dactylosporangium aurantiacum TaxID=35754 RepID=A0A9Q9IJ71_9ACTN|nr:hypothetical protein [Dactylosporangium aurantiacum]MDG6105565.1 hypothetical protein [Dactylosporangium aurantiacum]UWZ57092.1 hypothetical protein Daura_13535 [Dactylosporangium aurantiacum]